MWVGVLLSKFYLLDFLSLSTRSSLAVLFTNSTVVRRGRLSGAQEKSFFSLNDCFTGVRERIGTISVTIIGFRIPLKKRPCDNCPIFDTPRSFTLTLRGTNFSFFLLTGGRYLSEQAHKFIHAVRTLSSLKVHRAKAFLSYSRHRHACPVLLHGGSFHVVVLGCACNAGNLGISVPQVIGCVSGRVVGNSVTRTGLFGPSFVVTGVR